MTDGTTFDHLAYTFRAMDVGQCSLEQLAEKAKVNLFDVTPITLRNAMLFRGIEIENGIASLYEGHDFKDTITLGYKKFCQRAAEIVEVADEPVPAVDLIALVGFAEAAIPLSTMSRHLKKVGIWFIPGLGYWHKRQFVDQDGNIYGRKTDNAQAAALVEAFKEYGWPMTAIDLEAATSGVVTRRYVTHAVRRPWPDIVSVGYGLYVPAGAARRVGFPVSTNVARAILDLEPSEVLDSKDNTRMYRLCDLLRRFRYGVVRRSNTVRDGKQRRIAYFKLNDTGRRALNAVALSKKPDDEF